MEVRRHGAGSYSVVRIHGGVHHRHFGSVRQPPHRAQHALSLEAQKKPKAGFHHLASVAQPPVGCGRQEICSDQMVMDGWSLFDRRTDQINTHPRHIKAFTSLPLTH